jgi:hypothetical protein|tara:strand:- start:625 stop:873 length:249 start_codon:yes stop_codon:yes gene_type:complete
MSDKSKLYVTDTKIDNYEKSNYIKKIDDLIKPLQGTRGSINHIKIEHDGWCDIYKQKACNCDPNVSTISDAEGMSRLKGEIK